MLEISELDNEDLEAVLSSYSKDELKEVIKKQRYEIDDLKETQRSPTGEIVVKDDEEAEDDVELVQ